MSPFTWSVRLHLPDGWRAVSNGLAEPGGFESVAAPTVGDIALAASPHVAVDDVDGLARIVQVGQIRETSPLAASVGALVRTALESLTEAYGALPTAEPVSVVLTDREGYAYSRLPAIFLADAGSPDATRDLHTVLHELGHLWWNVAPSDGTDDWLNEALAEYSALWLSRELLTASFAEHLLDEYRALAKVTASPPVADTSPEQEPSFYANKHARGALLFQHVEDALGRERTWALLARWHQRWSSLRTASTESLLAALGQEDRGVMEQVKDCISTPSWSGTWAR